MNDNISYITKKLESVKVKYEIDDEIDLLVIDIPENRNKRQVYIDFEDASFLKIKSSDFYKYKFIEGYDAIWSPEDNKIECGLSLGNQMSNVRGFKYKLRRALGVKTIEFPFVFFSNDNLEIKFDVSSLEFNILCGLSDYGAFSLNDTKSIITIKITSVEASTHNEVKNILTTYLNSILFQLDIKTDIGITPLFDKNRNRKANWRRLKEANTINVSFPIYKYDDTAMSLYWNSFYLKGIPLQQFLSYYQVIEYFFPRYSYLEISKRIKNIVKDPLFDADNEKLINRIIETASVKKTSSIGDEKFQFKSTISSCLTEDELKEFLEESKEFYSGKTNKFISSYRLNLESNKSDIISDVTNRMYNIRCKIVHRKDGEDEVLLPNSRNVEYLKDDLRLIEFLARKVLISSSKKI